MYGKTSKPNQVGSFWVAEKLTTWGCEKFSVVLDQEKMTMFVWKNF